MRRMEWAGAWQVLASLMLWGAIAWGFRFDDDLLELEAVTGNRAARLVRPWLAAGSIAAGLVVALAFGKHFGFLRQWLLFGWPLLAGLLGAVVTQLLHRQGYRVKVAVLLLPIRPRWALQVIRDYRDVLQDWKVYTQYRRIRDKRGQGPATEWLAGVAASPWGGSFGPRWVLPIEGWSPAVLGDTPRAVEEGDDHGPGPTARHGGP